MKLYQLLPEGAVSQIAKAARAQHLVRKVGVEIKERKDHWHRSLLGTIDEYAAKGNYVKVLQLIRLYSSTYPNSPIADEVEKVREWASESLKPVKRVTRQGLPHVDKIPASWGKD